MKHRQRSHWIIFILILVAIVFAVLFSKVYSKILVPSYLSVRSGCGYITEQELNLIGYSIGGSTTMNYSNGTISPIISLNDVDEDTIRHELCHYHQALNGNFYGCENKLTTFFKFVNEVVCYTEVHNPYYRTKEVQEILNENLQE